MYACIPIPATGAEPANRFIQVPSGCFMMGNTFDDPYHIEMPVHEVCISAFSMSPFTVTRKEFSIFVSATGYKTDAERGAGCYVHRNGKWDRSTLASWHAPGFDQSDNHPVTCVSWNDASAYASWLSSREGRTFRLPTEAEWEYAARSGGKQERFAGSDDIDRVAWYSLNSGGHTHPVGLKNPNGLGLYDMSGNVWQWTGDWYDRFYYRESLRNNPSGPVSGALRVFRGGSWFYDQRGIRASYRDYAKPDYSSSYLGFRLVAPERP